MGFLTYLNSDVPIKVSKEFPSFFRLGSLFFIKEDLYSYINKNFLYKDTNNEYDVLLDLLNPKSKYSKDISRVSFLEYSIVNYFLDTILDIEDDIKYYYMKIHNNDALLMDNDEIVKMIDNFSLDYKADSIFELTYSLENSVPGCFVCIYRSGFLRNITSKREDMASFLLDVARYVFRSSRYNRFDLKKLGLHNFSNEDDYIKNSDLLFRRLIRSYLKNISMLSSS
ncbi:MAG: hypothetical protein QXF12_02545 [Candidatus Aenigmatarchaeota archaeon]